MKRVIFLIIDSMGIGAAPDADAYGDVGANTLGSISKSPKFHAENLRSLGLFNIEGTNHDLVVDSPLGSFARLQELSAGKDTVSGHWELSGIVSPDPMPTYPNGFPPEILDAFRAATGRGVLCNLPYSGTEVIEDYGKEHMDTGDLIVYTSADSVFQVAAHEDVVPINDLYKYCEAAREILTGPHAVGRVIARPFEGVPGAFKRTTRRHDYALSPKGTTILDVLKEEGYDVLSVGKIVDIFAGRGITDYVRTEGNTDGLKRTIQWMDRDFNGLMFVNLVDTDMIYGHRNDVDGYAGAVSEIDEYIGLIMEKMGADDILFISADHGCDPGFIQSTDHSREYVPLLMYGEGIVPGKDFGTVAGMNAAGATILRLLDTKGSVEGRILL